MVSGSPVGSFECAGELVEFGAAPVTRPGCIGAIASPPRVSGERVEHLGDQTDTAVGVGHHRGAVAGVTINQQMAAVTLVAACVAEPRRSVVFGTHEVAQPHPVQTTYPLDPRDGWRLCGEHLLGLRLAEDLAQLSTRAPSRHQPLTAQRRPSSRVTLRASHIPPAAPIGPVRSVRSGHRSCRRRPSVGCSPR